MPLRRAVPRIHDAVTRGRGRLPSSGSGCGRPSDAGHAAEHRDGLSGVDFFSRQGPHNRLAHELRPKLAGAARSFRPVEWVTHRGAAQGHRLRAGGRCTARRRGSQGQQPSEGRHRFDTVRAAGGGQTRVNASSAAVEPATLDRGARAQAPARRGLSAVTFWLASRSAVRRQRRAPAPSAPVGTSLLLFRIPPRVPPKKDRPVCRGAPRGPLALERPASPQALFQEPLRDQAQDHRNPRLRSAPRSVASPLAPRRGRSPAQRRRSSRAP